MIVLQDAFNELGSDKSRSDCKALLVDILNRAVEADLLLKNPALGTGKRIGEILGLTWDCIDFDNRIITVKQTLTYMPGDGQTAQYEFHQPKTKAGFRKIPMIKKVYDVLVLQQKRRNDIATHYSPREGFENLVFTFYNQQSSQSGEY